MNRIFRSLHLKVIHSHQSSICRNVHRSRNVIKNGVKRDFSGITRGTDLLEDSLSFSTKPKIIFDGHAPTGIDVINIITADDVESMNIDESSPKATEKPKLQSLHMNGSCLAFPHSCFLWKPRTAKEVTLKSLEVVMHIDPPIELLFIGCDSVIPPREMNKMKREFKEKSGIIVEQMTLVSFEFLLFHL